MCLINTFARVFTKMIRNQQNFITSIQYTSAIINIAVAYVIDSVSLVLHQYFLLTKIKLSQVFFLFLINYFSKLPQNLTLTTSPSLHLAKLALWNSMCSCSVFKAIYIYTLIFNIVGASHRSDAVPVDEHLHQTPSNVTGKENTLTDQDRYLFKNGLAVLKSRYTNNGEYADVFMV